MSEPLLTIARLTFPFPASALFGPARARDANPAGRSRFCTVLRAQETNGPRRGAAFGSTPQVK